MISRRQARRQALFLVYQWDLADGEIGERYGAELDAWAKELAEETVAHAHELDERISAASDEWPAGRLGLVERSALRVAIRELDRRDVPQEVVIDEAVGFTKRYASDDAAKLVNGILGRIQREAAGRRG
jgi:N utilization substance protein B